MTIDKLTSKLSERRRVILKNKLLPNSRWMWAKCPGCETKFPTYKVYYYNKKSRTCSRLCSLKIKGKVVIHENQTYRLYPNGYFMNSKNYKALHRVIWETSYGRRIPKGHHVHHKNGNKHDNRVSNLELLSASEHKKLHNKEGNPVYKLSPTDAVLIRALHKRCGKVYWFNSIVSKLFDCSPTAIQKVIKGKSYAEN